jgi:hypothetical protein
MPRIQGMKRYSYPLNPFGDWTSWFLVPGASRCQDYIRKVVMNMLRICYPFPILRVKEVHVVSIFTLSNRFGAPGSLGPSPATSHTRSLTTKVTGYREPPVRRKRTSKSMYPIYSSILYDNAIYCDIRYRADLKQGLRSSSSHCRQLPQVSLPMRHVMSSLQGANCR